MTHDHFMKKALAQAQKAFSAGEFPVGCVIADENRVLAEGFRQKTTKEEKNEIDHAEMVALRRLFNQGPPKNINALTLYCTMEPCLMCFGAILLAGIRKIVYAYEDVMGGATGCDRTGLPAMYRDARVAVVPHVLRKDSLELFKAYFSNPENRYWKASLLAGYTLAQK